MTRALPDIVLSSRSAPWRPFLARFPEPLWSALEERAEAEFQPLAVIVRRAVHEYLARPAVGLGSRG